VSERTSTSTKSRSFRMAYLLDSDGLSQLDKILREEVLAEAEIPELMKSRWTKDIEWTYPASVDTSASRSILSYQSNLLELGGAQIA
jgi:hypothetical protein